MLKWIGLWWGPHILDFMIDWPFGWFICHACLIYSVPWHVYKYMYIFIVHWSCFMIAHSWLPSRYASIHISLILYTYFASHIVHDWFDYSSILIDCHVSFILLVETRLRDLEGCYGFCRTFPISNLTPEPDPIFVDHLFQNKESHLGFSFLFCLPFKNKTKISGDSKSFS